MNNFEKIYSLLAIVFALGLIISLLCFPQLRSLQRLIPLCTLGLVINIGLIFVVLRDIFSRQFSDPNRKYFWLALVLLCWPSILFYLPRYGFRPRVG